MRFGKRFSPNFALTKKSPVIESVSYKVGRQYTGWPSWYLDKGILWEQWSLAVFATSSTAYLVKIEFFFQFKQSDVKMASIWIESMMPVGAANFSIVVVIAGNPLQIMVAAYRVKRVEQVAWVRVELMSCGVAEYTLQNAEVQLSWIYSPAPTLTCTMRWRARGRSKCDKRKQEKLQLQEKLLLTLSLVLCCISYPAVIAQWAMEHIEWSPEW